MEIKNALLNYGADVKAVGKDFVSPYRHFIHWNLSKVATFVYAAIAGLVFSVPFLLTIAATIYYALSFPAGEATKTMLSQNSVTPLLIQAVLFENGGKVAFIALLVVCIIAVFSVFVSYGYFLLANVYRSYAEGVELPVLKNRYFDWKGIWKFTATLGWSSLYVLAPIVVALFVFAGIAFWSYGENGMSEAVSYKVGLATAITLFFTFWTVLYFAFRTGFATFELLAEEGAYATGREYVRRSMAMTKGKVARTMLVVLPFVIVTGLAEQIVTAANQSLSVSRMYEGAVKLKEQTAKDKTDADFVSDQIDRSLDNEDASMAVSIISEHKPQKDGIDRNFFNEIAPYLDRQKIDPSWKNYDRVFAFVSFFLLDGLVLMAYFSAFLQMGGKLRNGNTAEVSEESEESGPEPESKPEEKAKKAAVKKPAPKKEKTEEKPVAKKAPAKKKPAVKKAAE